ncbi:MAG: hypothetical protein ACK421_12350 [Pseudanabaenaceae cyanobacterium]
MDTIVKILLLSVGLSVAIKYGLPWVVDWQGLSLLERDRVAMLLLVGIPGLFLAYLWRR